MGLAFLGVSAFEISILRVVVLRLYQPRVPEWKGSQIVMRNVYSVPQTALCCGTQVPGTCWGTALLLCWALSYPLPTSLLQTQAQTRLRNGYYPLLVIEGCSSGFSKVLLLLTAGASQVFVLGSVVMSRQRLHSFGSPCCLRLNGGWQMQDGRQTLLRSHRVLLSGETLSCHVLCMQMNVDCLAAF